VSRNSTTQRDRDQSLHLTDDGSAVGELSQGALLAFRCSCRPVEQLCKVDTAAVA
jgi:hypothetical protein